MNITMTHNHQITLTEKQMKEITLNILNNKLTSQIDNLVGVLVKTQCVWYVEGNKVMVSDVFDHHNNEWVRYEVLFVIEPLSDIGFLIKLIKDIADEG